jgi:hypothetical protein
MEDSMLDKITIAIACVALAGGVAAAEDAKPAPPAEHKDSGSGAASAEIKAGTGVEKHEIVGEAASFTAGTTVWVWSRIENGEGNVKHIWKLDGKEVWTATLPVSSKKWSTQTRRTIAKAGSWEVEVQTESGTSLGSVKFTVT